MDDVGPVDHVRVCEDQAGGIDDHARSESLLNRFEDLDLLLRRDKATKWPLLRRALAHSVEKHD